MAAKKKPKAQKKVVAKKKTVVKKKVSTKKKMTTKKKTASKKKTSAKKKTVAKKKTSAKKKIAAKKKVSAKKKTVAKKKTLAKKKVTAKKKTSVKKKPVVKKKVATKKKTVAKKKPSAQKKTAVKEKTAVKTKTTEKKDTTVKKESPTKKVVVSKEPKIAKSKASVKIKNAIMVRTPVKKPLPELRIIKSDINDIRPKLSEKEIANVSTSLSLKWLGEDVEPYADTGTAHYMNEPMKAHFRKILNLWKRQLMEEVDRTKSHMQDEAANYPDPSDRATQEEEFSLELRTRDRERKLIKKIEESLDDIDNDEYGYCESCGVEIGVRRLEARPTATLCIDCKTVDEIREKQTTL